MWLRAVLQEKYDPVDTSVLQLAKLVLLTSDNDLRQLFSNNTFETQYEFQQDKAANKLNSDVAIKNIQLDKKSTIKKEARC